MAMRGMLICLVVGLALAAPVGAKEGMTATLLGHTRLDAKPGTRITVAWEISSAAAQAAARSGDDDRFYVRLLSKTGKRSTHAYGRFRGDSYLARVRVPRGGVGDIEIRLKGWMITPDATRRADMLIPIANDPRP
jgi:hypothetical protein